MRSRFSALAGLSVLIGLASGTAGAAVEAPVNAPAVADRDTALFDLLTGPGVDTGTYGTKRHVTDWSWDTTLNWQPFDMTSLGLTLPYLIQRAPAGTIAGRAARARPHVGLGPDVTTDGIGDLILSGDQDLLKQNQSNPLDVGVTAQVTLPTASVSKGLGSGKADYTFQGDLGHTFGKVYCDIRGGYSLLGSPGKVDVNGVSEVLRYRNVWMGSASAIYDITNTFIVDGAFQSERSSEKGFPPADDLTFGTLYKFHAMKLRLTLLRGLSRSSPDWGGTALLGVDL